MQNTVENKDLINRKTASRLLKVAIRTLDRYRQAGHITTRIIDNKIWLSKSEILEFIEKQRDPITRHSRQYKSINLSHDKIVDTDRDGNDTEVVYTQEDGEYKAKTHSASRDTPFHDDTTSDKQSLIETYKRMHDELAAHLQARQEELEAAYHRIGQLEGQIRYTVPLPEHKKEVLRLTESTQSLENEISDKLQRLKKIREALYYEKLNKRIYLAIVIGLLLLQPLWLLMIER